MKSLFSIFLIFSVFIVTSAQSRHQRIVIQNTETILENLSQVHLSQIEKYDKPKVLKEVYESRFNFIKNCLDKGSFFHEDNLNNYINSIANEIIKANPELKSLPINFYISDFPSPNAFSIGDGNIIINLGLIRKIHSESQLAFVICHEIAHFILDHSNKKVIKNNDYVNSKEYKQDLKKIKNLEFGRNAAAIQLYKSTLIDFMSHSREAELEADSKGLELFLNTNYAPGEAVTCLQFLDSIDSYKYGPHISFKDIFQSEEYPFKDRWLEKEVSMFNTDESIDKSEETDLYKSHPDSKIRAQELEKVISGLEPKAVFIQSKEELENIKSWLDIEFINSFIKYNDYGKAFFFTLLQLESEPYNKELLQLLSKELRLIYEVNLDHTYDDHIERPGHIHENEYNKTLQLLDNIRISELRKLSLYFHLNKLYIMDDSKEFINNKLFFESSINQ
ncbi:M48 family metallopeptidase [Marinigracilibium pacificum]|uniref:M48 family metalloprotease n=1 Tax=Marinigracilibium pacificum TaxID=2729599 RepID=A0A848J5Y5_9BACT|nr:M48 family metallopeptidase [Marinigracilibium pacificum]NMM48542.1 M48 family metalloprotease [Marinigracilibium pacificum]